MIIPSKEEKKKKKRKSKSSSGFKMDYEGGAFPHTVFGLRDFDVKYGRGGKKGRGVLSR